jgi:regulator of protease activity HflC (stomatin/prohibitin superfamily)
MGDFLKALIDLISFWWPGRRVEQWEVAGRYWKGQWVKQVGPGIYWIVPWFGDIKTISVATSLVGTGRQDFTLPDGKLLSFAATASLRVVDPYKALNSVDGYQESMQELLQSVAGDQLSREKVEQLDQSKRTFLLSRLKKKVVEEAAQYGIEVMSVSFTSFVTEARAYRLMIDQTQMQAF